MSDIEQRIAAFVATYGHCDGVYELNMADARALDAKLKRLARLERVAKAAEQALAGLRKMKKAMYLAMDEHEATWSVQESGDVAPLVAALAALKESP